jgi:outer membrane lipoprotein-sorting protein
MKKMMIFTMVFVTLTAVAICSDIKLKEILETNYESSGGLEKIKSLKTVYIKGKVTIPMQGMEIPMEMWYQAPDKARMEAEFQGMKILQVYDGKIAWGVVPFAGITEPQELPEDQATEIIDQAEGMYPLLDYKEKGHTLEYLGTEDMQGTEVYKLKFTHKKGKVVYFFLDMESCIELKTLTYVTRNEVEYKSETYFGDYKEFDGLMFPTSLQVHVNDQHQSTITFDEINVNVDIKDDLFTMPESNQ